MKKKKRQYKRPSLKKVLAEQNLKNLAEIFAALPD